MMAAKAPAKKPLKKKIVKKVKRCATLPSLLSLAHHACLPAARGEEGRQEGRQEARGEVEHQEGADQEEGRQEGSAPHGATRSANGR